MTPSDARKMAAEIIGIDAAPFSFRNVWVFYNDPDCEIHAVFITKDNADTEISGIFLDKGEESGFTEYKTNRSVTADAVFGKTFFDGDPSLLVDRAPENTPVADRIDSLFSESARLLLDRGLPAEALILLRDIANSSDEEETVLLRLVILRNYLSKTEKQISVTEFAFMRQDLYRI